MPTPPTLDQRITHAQQTLTAKHGKQAGDLFGCLITGLFAALPAFLEAFISCLGMNPGNGEYDPGDRKRCD